MLSAALARGDRAPDFDVTTLDGRHVRYAELWQRRNLVLVTVPRAAADAARGYLANLEGRLAALTADDTALVACVGPAASVPESMLVICDRWGEVVHSEELHGGPDTWPPAEEIVEWVTFVRMQCPECPP